MEEHGEEELFPGTFRENIFLAFSADAGYSKPREAKGRNAEKCR